jgi:hypothetical protein
MPDTRMENPKREREEAVLPDEGLAQEHKRLMVETLAAFTTVDEADSPTVIGAPEGLDPEQVKAGRALELQRLREFGVYTAVPRSEADRVVSTRWVEVQKAPGLVRSRLVAKDFAVEKREDLFAATPGLVATRLALAVLADRWAAGQDWVAKTADVSVAFLHAPVDTENPQYVMPPPDAGEPPGVVWRLERSLYGTRSAPRNWQLHLVGLLAQAGWTRGRADPATFFNGQALLIVHVDDFLCVGPRATVDSLMTTLSNSLLLKVSEELRAGHSLNFLGREISRVDNAVVFQPFSRLIRKLGEMFGLSGGSHAVSTPWVKQKLDESEPPLDPDGQKTFRSAVGILLYLSFDRGDVQFAVKELSRRLGKATPTDMCGAKRVVRYLLGTSSFGTKFEGSLCSTRCGKQAICVETFCDSDWAGCERTRKSTSGGVQTVGNHVLNTWSRTQQTISLSSGEAEFYALGTGAAESIFLSSLMAEILPASLRPNFPIQLRTDATAGRGVCNRLGPGKIRHLDIRNLWLQQLVEKKVVAVSQVKGEANPADLLTKGVAKPVLERLRPRLQLEAWNPQTVAVCTVRGPKTNFKGPVSSRTSWGECHGGSLRRISHKMVQHGLVGGLIDQGGSAKMFSTSVGLGQHRAKRDDSSNLYRKTVGSPSCFPSLFSGAVG